MKSLIKSGLYGKWKEGQILAARVNQPRKINRNLRSKLYCAFCGKDITDMKLGPGQKYCSKYHQQMASKKNYSRRMGIPAKVSRLDSLYFD